MSDQQLREPESVFRVVAARKRGLTFYVNFALANYRDPENEKKSYNDRRGLVAGS